MKTKSGNFIISPGINVKTENSSVSSPDNEHFTGKISFCNLVIFPFSVPLFSFVARIYKKTVLYKYKEDFCTIIKGFVIAKQLFVFIREKNLNIIKNVLLL